MREVYPKLDDPNFAEKLANMEEFAIFHLPKVATFENKESFEEKAKQLCQFEKTYYQHLVSQYLSKRSPYKSLLLYHGLGSGKTCSAITIAEALHSDHLLTDAPPIWVISRKALKGSFEQEIFRTNLLVQKDISLENQCTGNMYYRMIPNAKDLPKDKLIQRIQKIIKSKYQFFGYDQFANQVQSWKEQGIFSNIIHNKVIIIDEAHNLRNLETNEEHPKKIVEPLLDVLKQGTGNRLVLLSATPMYNEAEEMLWLLSLLLANDHRNDILDPFHLPSFFSKSGKPNSSLFELCKQLSQTYISYIRGNNPFTFAVRLQPSNDEVSFIKEAPKIMLNGEPLASSEKAWLSWIPSQLVSSPIGKTQLEALEAYESRKKQKISSATLRQMNICVYKKYLGADKYDFQEGKEGLTAVFSRVDDLEPIQYEYQKSKEPLFDPSFGKLQDFAPKLYTLQKLLQKSKGVVVIYTMFVWGGIVPTAMMLEHIGFSRYKERDFLKMPSKVSKSVEYSNIRRPAYCILSGEGDKDIMGSTTIDDLLKDINSSDNIHGEKIKVVLISPVAGEGLSFKNVREMHVLDPWYHLNNQEQAIGRAIRNCSHSSLPLEERNVTVFLHSTVYQDNHKETSDLHAYRLSAIKYQQIQKIDKIIQENAMDCLLMNAINVFPKDLFNFEVMLHTSRGKQIPYHYGDEMSKMIHCKSTDYKTHDVRNFREESYATFIPTLQQRLKKLLLSKEQNVYTYNELIGLIHPNVEIATKVLQSLVLPYKLQSNKAMIYHNQKFIIAELDSQLPQGKRLQYQPEEQIEPIVPSSGCTLMEVLEQVEKDSLEVATLNIYQSLDSKCWSEFAERIIQTPISQVSTKLNKALSILEKQGAFILKNEVLVDTPSKYSGYVNLFSDEDKFEVIIWDEDAYREATQNEVTRIKKLREYHPYTNPMKTPIANTIGMLQRYRGKDPNTAWRFQFKLGLNNEKVKRLGIVCESGLKKPQIEEEVIKYIKGPVKGNVSQLCFKLMLELLKDRKLWLPPIYKMK